MRLKSWASNLLLVIVAIVAIGIITGVHVRTQAPFLVFGSSSGSSQVIQSTANALWVSIQGGPVTSPLTLPDGLATAPSIAFTSQPQLGFYRSAANTIAAGNGVVTFALGGANMTVAQVTASSYVISSGVAFASLGTPANGSLIYCTDCTETTPASCPVTQASCICAASGNGAFARRVNGAWYCTF